jgi:uncharacterized protein YdaU (DUF1376 family)
MAKEQAPAFQFYPKDFLSDPRVTLLPPEAIGAYVLLLCYCWSEQKLANDIETLRTLSRCDRRKWARIAPMVLPLFECDGTSYRHKRLDEERAKQEAFREGQSRHGVAGARARWRHGDPIATPMPKYASSSASAFVQESTPLPPCAARPPLDPDVAALPKHANHRRGRRGSQAFEWRANVPDALHQEFRRKLGGPEDQADAALRAWYRTIADAWPDDQVIGDDDWAFWRARFREWQGTTERRAQTTAATAPVYGPADWCQHEPRCNSRDWHDVLVLREPDPDEPPPAEEPRA